MRDSYDAMGTLEISNSVVNTVVNEVMKLDGSPIYSEQVRKTMRALIVLGWNDWPEED